MPSSRNRLIIARITWVEVLSALARLQREGNLASADVDIAVRTFRYALDMQYQVVELDATLALAAGQLVQQYPLRAYDSVQLASALQVQTVLAHVQSASFVFVSADNRLLTVAQTIGIVVDNPNDHP